MNALEVSTPRKPAWFLAAVVTLALTMATVYLRLAVYPRYIVPLAYAIPLLACLWHRDRRLLWAMAACFMVVAAVKVVWLMPREYFRDDLQQFVFTAMHWLNIVVPAGVVDLTLVYRQRIERSNRDLATANAELEASNEELAAREEEISRQNEELQAQAEELEQQAQELRTLNAELAGRETTLQMLLSLSGPAASEPEVLHQICAAAPKLLGEDVSAAAILERRNGHVVVRSHSEFGRETPQTTLPVESTVAGMALERMQVAELEDTQLRPDLQIPPSPSAATPRAILSVPLSLADGTTGAIEAYASRPRRWTGQQAKLLHWLAGQCTSTWESVRLREQLRREQAQFRTMADAIPQLAWMAEPDGYVSWYNRRWYEYTGTTPEQMEGWQWQSVHDPRVLPQVLQEWQESLSSGESFNMTFPLRGADGMLRPFLTRVMPLKDDQGRVVRWFGTNTDVSEQKRTEEELRESRERLTWVLDTTGVGLWLNELPLSRLNWDQRTRELYFIPADVEPTIELFWERLHPDDRETTRLAMEAALRDHTLYTSDHRALDPATGEIRWIRSAGRATHNAEGVPIRFDGVNYDITDRKRHEEQVAKLTRLYAVLSQVNEAIVRAPDVATLYSRVCRIVAETGGFALAWIGEVRAAQVVPSASGGPAADYLKEIRVDVEGELGGGPTGTCIRENRAVVNADFAANPATSPWREAALRHHLRASAAFPLRRQGTTVGALTLYARDSHVFDAEQIGLLDALSADLSYALDAFDREQLRVCAEQARRESEERLRLHVENTPLAVIEWGPDFRLSRWSAEAERIFGWRADEVLGKRLDDFCWIHDEDSGQVAQISAKLVDGTCPRSVSGNRNYRKDRSIVHCEWYNSSLVDKSGQLRSILSLVLDVTDRKRAEGRTRLLSEVTAQLLASDQPQRIVEALCRKVMEHLGCQVFFNFLVDEEKHCLRLNASAGVSEEVMSQLESMGFGVAVCGCVARDGRRIVAEHIQATPDPRTDLVRSLGIQAYACHPLLNQGQTIGTLSFGSRLKPAFNAEELELMKNVADHVAIAMQRIRLLRSLEHHARAAEAANAAKSQFLANMSHELRTPMNAILGMIDVALPKAANPTVQDCLQTAKGSADLLLTLLNDLLDSAKIESGKLELESAPFSLRRMLDQTTRVLSMRASEKGLCFLCRTSDETPDAVVGDRMRLQQILLNLAGNAVKFTEHGHVGVHVGVSSHPNPLPEPERDMVLEFAVVDTGIGIPSADLENIFHPFAQADATMARRFGGTGLGLSISKSLVEMMGGRLWVESQVGRGSTFHFTVRLPLAKELPADFETPTASTAAPCAPLRILLVEDNPANQKLATYILQDRRHVVEIAEDGQEAVRLTGQNAYDVVLMDVQMPGMNGLEATAAIRNRDVGRRRVPIIAMTAHAMRGDRDRCLAAGMDGYLSKPVKAQEMIGLVETLARGTEPATQPVAAAPDPVERPSRVTAAVFDPEQTLTRCFNNRHMVGEMIRCFFDEVDSLFPQMRAALGKGDLAEVGRLGHRLKGTVVYLGAESARQAAMRVERLCTSSDGAASGAEEAVNVLERECAMLEAALREHPLGTAPRQGD